MKPHGQPLIAFLQLLTFYKLLKMQIGIKLQQVHRQADVILITPLRLVAEQVFLMVLIIMFILKLQVAEVTGK